jgi:2-methylisocitrate lyase-like PEP mutase family enzyme
MTDNNNSNQKARLLRSLHDGPVLVLPNAWDAGSAVLIAGAGARAIATTSGGVAWSLARPDGQWLSRDDMMRTVERIANAVDVPVTADVEAGYGHAPDDVALTVESVIAAGAVGINLEDSRAPGEPLFAVDEQADRIRAARTAAAAHGVPDLVINARTDVHLFQVGDPDDRPGEVRRRANAYAAAGADCLFVPGLLDLAALEALVAASPLPINAMAVAGGPTVAALAAAGVRRISVGSALAQAAYTVAQRAASELLTSGTYTAGEGAMSFQDLDSQFARPTG